jgi:transcription elongation factor Elf1
LRAHGHRVNCPSCDSVALLHGSPAGAESSTYKDGLIVNRQPMLPSTFECKACGLKIVGYSKLNACGLGGTFTSTSYTDPIDYFEDDFRDRFSGMDDDNNEP